MENGSSFEKNMKDKLFNYSEEPNPHVWEKIQIEIEKPQSVSEILFPWAGPGLDLIVAILLIFQLNVTSLYLPKPLLASNSSTQTKVEKLTAYKVNEHSKKTESSISGNEKGNLPRQNSAKVEIATPGAPETNTKNLSAQENKDDYQNTIVDSPRDEKNSYDYLMPTPAGNSKGINSALKDHNDQTKILFTPYEQEELTDPAMVESSAFLPSGIIRCGLPPNGVQAKSNLSEINRKGPMLSIVYLDVASLQTLPEDYTSGNPFRAEASKKWLLDLWYAPSLGFSEFDESNTSVKTSYRALRDSAESPAYYGSFGISLGRKLTDRFFLSAGLQYTQRVEQFTGVYQWDVPVVKVDTIVHTKIIGSTLPRTAIIEYDTVITTSRKSKLLTHKVNFQTWEIPLRAGIRFDKENVVFSLQAGIIATWKTKVHGTILDPVLMEEIIVKPGIERQLLLSGTLSAGIEWKLGQRLSLLMEPQYRYFFQSPYADAFALKMKWQSLALMSGIRVRF